MLKKKIKSLDGRNKHERDNKDRISNCRKRKTDENTDKALSDGDLNRIASPLALLGDGDPDRRRTQSKFPRQSLASIPLQRSDENKDLEEEIKEDVQKDTLKKNKKFLNLQAKQESLSTEYWRLQLRLPEDYSSVRS